MERWYVLHTKPGKEWQVAAQLRQRHLEVYLPLVAVQPVNPRAARERAFFPGYLFVRADLETIAIGALQWTPGLNQVVQFGGQPAYLLDRFILELKRRLEGIRLAGGLIFETLEPGDQVKIVRGQFAGYEGVFDLRLSGTERVRVLLQIIQHNRLHPDPHSAKNAGRYLRFMPVELNAGALEKVRQRPH